MDDEARRADSQTDSNQAVVEREVLFSKFMKLKKDLAQVESTIKAMNEDYTRNITRLQLQKQSLEQAMSHLKACWSSRGTKSRRNRQPLKPSESRTNSRYPSEMPPTN